MKIYSPVALAGVRLWDSRPSAVHCGRPEGAYSYTYLI